MALPPGAMPWGRWAESNATDTLAAVDVIRSDANSAGSQFASRADNMAAQVAGVDVATISTFDAPNFSYSAGVGAPLAPYRNVVSSAFTFTPPSAETRSCVVVLNFRVSATVGTVPDIPMLKVNGVQFGDANTESVRPDGSRISGIYSVQGSVPLASGQQVTVQYGAKVSPFIASSLFFTNATIWVAYYGGVG